MCVSKPIFFAAQHRDTVTDQSDRHQQSDQSGQLAEQNQTADTDQDPADNALTVLQSDESEADHSCGE